MQKLSIIFYKLKYFLFFLMIILLKKDRIQMGLQIKVIKIYFETIYMAAPTWRKNWDSLDQNYNLELQNSRNRHHSVVIMLSNASKSKQFKSKKVKRRLVNNKVII